MANLEYLGFNSFNKYECLRPWEREWIEDEQKPFEPEPLQLPVDNYPMQEPEHKENDDQKRGVVIIEL